MRAFEPALNEPGRPGRQKGSATPATNTASARDPIVRQSYESYSPLDHATWHNLHGRMRERWQRYADERFLEGLKGLRLPADEIPRLDRVSEFLVARTGFRAKPVCGHVPAFEFFDCLQHRELPIAVNIRSAAALDHLDAPDIFHDVAGHVPMHADPCFAETLVAFGECAHTAAEIAGLTRDPDERLRKLTSHLRALLRLYWFTVECGLVRSGNHLRAYGSGLLTSAGELEHAIDSPEVQRSDVHLDWVIHQSFELGHYQPLLFIVDGIDQLLELTRTLERWMRDGRLDHVAPGQPEVSQPDLASFLEACGLP